MPGAVALVEPRADLGGRVGRVGRQLHPRELERLALVGRDQVEVAEGERAARLGVEGDERAGGAGQRGHPGDELVVQDALGVVGEDHGVAGGDVPREQGLGLGGAHAVVGGRGLAVDPAQLLPLHHHAGFHDRLPPARRAEGLDALGLQHLAQLAARLVLPEEAGDRAVGAQRGEVQGDVAGAAGRPGLAVHVDHRHRRLGRDARGITPDVAVEHQVADNKDAQARDFAEQAGQAL
ncbi:MAG: hypothetical protein NT173_00165 [Opitutales bacterium]|nr:hypothetical protein [Opitutales bacterium]